MMERVGRYVSVAAVAASMQVLGVESPILARVDFRSPPYQALTWRGERVDLREHNRRGPKGKGSLWNWESRSDAGTPGFARFHFWQYRVANPGRAGDKWEDNAGFLLPGSSLEPSTGWSEHAEYFGRARIRIVAPLRPERSVAGGTATNKWLIANGEHRDGDHRLMIHLSNTGGSEPCVAADSAYPSHRYMAIRIAKNIGDQCAGSVLQIGRWEQVQWSWRMGPSGKALVRLWVNNDDESHPTSERILSEPWIMDPQGMNGAWHIGGYLSDELDTDASWDVADLEIATAFDGRWSRSGR